MGLGAPKNRKKLSHDPNNTAWSKSTENFGHRILSSQGWKPGEYLGASNAAHADHYTAANASHVRVFLREENLGIGAKVGGKGNAETFGLSTLSSIFGRLNGKSDAEVQIQQNNLRNAELRTYQAQKYGFMNFVSGGLLVGDKMEETVRDAMPATVSDVVLEDVVPQVKGNKKRKAEAAVSDSAPDKPLKKKKRSSDLRAEAGTRSPRAIEKAATIENSAVDSERAGDDSEGSGNSDDQIARRAQKAARKADCASRRKQKDSKSDERAREKEEKRARKEARRKRREEKEEKGIRQAAAKSPNVVSAMPTPPSGGSTPVSAALAFGGGRHAVRQRYIQQKRMASMDPQALKEILMIKAQG